jgi:hypothetical protein
MMSNIYVDHPHTYWPKSTTLLFEFTLQLESQVAMGPASGDKGDDVKEDEKEEEEEGKDTGPEPKQGRSKKRKVRGAACNT